MVDRGFYLSALSVPTANVKCWSSVSIGRIVYKFLNECPFDYTAFAISGQVKIPLTDLTTPV